jgi:hypothetical protein
MNQVVSNGFWGFLEPMAKQIADPQGEARMQKKPPTSKEVKLSFTTQRMVRAKTAEDVGDIVINASPTEALSYEPTVPVSVNRSISALENFTIQTKLTIKYFKRSQAFTLIMTSMMGFLIGVFIGIFI